ncbi:MAG: TIGR03790 family protein [Chthoniobacter sp.]
MKLFPRTAHLLVLALIGGLLPVTMAAPKPGHPPAVHPASAPNPYAAATLVVFNEADRDSVELAHFYAEKRGIPKEQVIGLKTAKTEEITRDEYEHTIAEPLRRMFTANLWWKLREPESPLGPVESNKIHFVALMRGIPLKIAEAPGYPGDKAIGAGPVATVNAAAVDSELSVLGLRTHVISGAMPNPYFRSFSGIADAHRPELLLVCRLDAPSPEIVRRMITDSIEAEENGLTGLAYIDARNIKEAGYLEGDTWLYALANSARRHGTPVVLDNGPGLFPRATRWNTRDCISAGMPNTSAGHSCGRISASPRGPSRCTSILSAPRPCAIPCTIGWGRCSRWVRRRLSAMSTSPICRSRRNWTSFTIGCARDSPSPRAATWRSGRSRG